jgi:hypothetical protein
MPGGRLTQQEHRQIALGLADGLAYAEIARRLDRPISTITREVMRNGSPTGYRADLSHRATERRAHRRRPASSRGAESVPHLKFYEIEGRFPVHAEEVPTARSDMGGLWSGGGSCRWFRCACTPGR